MSIRCSCGSEYDRIGTHWRFNENHIPELTKKQHEIITGSMMGDGTVVMVGDAKYPQFKLRTNSKEYLKNVRKNMKNITYPITLGQKTENNVKQNKDMWRIATPNHPELFKYRDWYKTGSKTWPSDLKLTPTIVKHWFVQDGHKKKRGRGRPAIQIALDNERGNKDKIFSYFESSDCPTPDRWHEDKYNTRVVWNVDKAEKLWNYMGESLSGYEYKW